MIEFLDNYENKNSSRYPCICIDWLTNFEIQYIQNSFSSYDNSIDELSEINGSKEEIDDLYSEVEENKSDDLFDDVFGDGSFENAAPSEDDFDLFDEDIFGGESFGDDKSKNDLDDENILEELLKISEEEQTPIQEVVEQDLFSRKLPIFVDEEKIAEANLDKETLKILNHFFKRKWLLKLSEEEEQELSEEFFIKNVLNLC